MSINTLKFHCSWICSAPLAPVDGVADTQTEQDLGWGGELGYFINFCLSAAHKNVVYRN